MSHIHLDRRDFLLSSAAAIASLCLGSLRALARTTDIPTAADGDLLLARCAGSEKWVDLSPDAIAHALAEDHFFTIDAADAFTIDPSQPIESSAQLCLLAASLQTTSALSRVQIRVEYPSASAAIASRMFTAIVASPGECPSGLLCQVPIQKNSIPLSILCSSPHADDAAQRILVPARRGIYAIVSQDGHATSRVRMSGGVIQSDWACCTILAVAPSPPPTK